MHRMKIKSLRGKLIFPVMITMLLSLLINLFLFYRINTTTDHLERVYDTNIRLSEFENLLQEMEEDIYQYLNVRNMDSLNSFLEKREELSEILLEIDEQITDQPGRRLERNIRELGISYLQLTEKAIREKQDHDPYSYQKSYEEIQAVYGYLLNGINGLDALRFRTNSENYDVLYRYLRYLELFMTAILVFVTVNLMVLLYYFIGNLTKPLERLSKRAAEIGNGRFETENLLPETEDEIGTVTQAFNQMLLRIHDYIEKTKKSMALELEMRERQHHMENLLKNAQLKYYQAQINPHFLFNTLNAGQQLAMMEDAERTYSFIENMAQFFRYRLKKNGEESTLRDELGLIDSYMYIMNVRYSGEIHIVKAIDERLLDQQFPGMVLQPVVENALNHGLSSVEWEKEIHFLILQEQEHILIQISDNGMGMSQELQDKINHGEYQGDGEQKNSGNGVGIMNVRERLRLYYNREDVLWVESAGEGKGTTVSIRVPYVTE